MADANKDTWTKFGIGILAILLFAGLTYYFAELSIGLMAAVVVVLVLDYPLTWLEQQGLSRGVALVSVVAIGLVLLGIVGALISMVIVNQYDQVVAQVPQIVDVVKEQRVKLQGVVPQENLQDQLSDEDIKNIQATLLGYIRDTVRFVGSLLLKVGFLTILMTAIMLATRGTLKQTIVGLVPNRYFEVSITSLNAVISTLRDYIFAKFLQTVTVALICILGFFLIGLPGALILGLLAGLLNLIPYFGPLISAVIPLLIGLLRNEPLLAIGGVIVIGISQLVDNLVLQPILIAKIVNVHPLMVVIVTFVGAKLLGPFGMIIAIPAYVILRITLTQFYNLLVALQKRRQLFEPGNI